MYWFGGLNDSRGEVREFETVEEAVREWTKDGADAPSSIFWTTYDERGLAIAEGGECLGNCTGEGRCNCQGSWVYWSR